MTKGRIESHRAIEYSESSILSAHQCGASDRVIDLEAKLFNSDGVASLRKCPECLARDIKVRLVKAVATT
jgi:hypothetical protein